MSVTKTHIAADQAKSTIDAMICLVRSHASDRDPVTGIQDQLLEMRHALDATD